MVTANWQQQKQKKIISVIWRAAFGFLFGSLLTGALFGFIGGVFAVLTGDGPVKFHRAFFVIFFGTGVMGGYALSLASSLYEFPQNRTARCLAGAISGFVGALLLCVYYGVIVDGLFFRVTVTTLSYILWPVGGALFGALCGIPETHSRARE